MPKANGVTGGEPWNAKKGRPKAAFVSSGAILGAQKLIFAVSV
jgi:hypothetical protein